MHEAGGNTKLPKFDEHFALNTKCIIALRGNLALVVGLPGTVTGLRAIGIRIIGD